MATTQFIQSGQDKFCGMEKRTYTILKAERGRRLMPWLEDEAGSFVNQQPGWLRYPVAQASSLLVRASSRCQFAGLSRFLTLG
jgi:hypothetical protein